MYDCKVAKDVYGKGEEDVVMVITSLSFNLDQAIDKANRLEKKLADAERTIRLDATICSECKRGKGAE